jgi:hypothetical protein
MKVKILMHLMPWEIDYALLTFTQLKRSRYFLPENVDVEVATVLNLSSFLIDWNTSQMPKEFFKRKYEHLTVLLQDYKHTCEVYEGDELYGHLDFQRECIQQDVDHYIVACPDTYFGEHLLAYMIQAAEQINNEYFVLTPQICRMWDESWEEITHPKFAVGPHYGWEKTTDIFDVDNYIHISNEPVGLSTTQNLKWAGWFDLYNKKFYEDLVGVPQEWRGYGGWDAYGLITATAAKQKGYDFQQYCLTGQIVFEYSIGPLRTEEIHGFSNYYKKFLVRKDVSEQRDQFNENLPFFIQRKITAL